MSASSSELNPLGGDVSRIVKFLISLLVIGSVGAITGRVTYALFSGTTENTGNLFAAGTVSISDNDSGDALVSLTSAKPGDTSTGCIMVTYDGSLDSTVRLYASISGGLADFLTLTVTRGTDSAPSFSSCTNFTPDGTDYNGFGPGVIFSGSLAVYPTTYAFGMVDPDDASPETWTTSEAHSYRYSITLDNNNAAQGLSATVTFTWEARNL